jgi:predicted dinucleotide-binding enzyme
MSYAIIGFGNIGRALAKAFARKGIEVSVAATRDPESIAADAAAIGPAIIPLNPRGSRQGGHHLFGCPFRVAPGCREGAAHLAGEDCRPTACPLRNWEDSLLPSSSRRAFTGARPVKGFNHLIAATLDQDPAVHGGRRVVFLASDDDAAAAEIGTIAENLGFSPIKLGGLSEGGLLVQARGNSWGHLIFKDLVKFDG